MAWLDTWVFPLGSVLLGGLGLLLLVRGLFGRRFLVRRTRGCRRCRYDMSATGGHTCPECGHTARHEGEHYAGRRRWLVAAMGFMLLIGAGAAAMAPGVRREGWLTLLPASLQVRLYVYETNQAALAGFDEWLWRTPAGGGRFPNPGPGTSIRFSRPLPAISNEERLDDLKRRACKTAVRVVVNESIGSSRVQRCLQVIQSAHWSRGKFITAEDLGLLIDRLGTGDKLVASMVSNWDRDANESIARARRSIFEHGDFLVQTRVIRSIASHPFDEEDVRLAAVYLAEPYPADVAETHSKAAAWPTPAPAQVWTAFATMVEEGKWCNTATLLTGMRQSPEVGQAALQWATHAPRSNRLSQASVPLQGAIEHHGLIPNASGVPVWRSRLRAEQRFDQTADLFAMALCHADPDAASFLISIARSADESGQRGWATRAMRSVQHDLGSVCEFLADEIDSGHVPLEDLAVLLRSVERADMEGLPAGFDPTGLWVLLLDRIETTADDDAASMANALKGPDLSLGCMVALIRKWEQRGEWSPRLAEMAESSVPADAGGPLIHRFLREVWRRGGSLESDAPAVRELREAVPRIQAHLESPATGQEHGAAPP